MFTIKCSLRFASTLPALMLLLTTTSLLEGAEPLGTAFTYQGQLSFDGEPLSATVDLRFTLWDADADGTQIGSADVVSNVIVEDGLFMTEVDFGASNFNGQARWLEIGIRNPAGSGSFAELSPRNKLTVAPYALQTRGLFVTDAGNIGIGTTAPGAKVGVVGNIRVTGKIEPGGGTLNLSGGGSGVNIYMDEDGGSNDTFRIFDTGEERFRVDGNTGAVTANSFAGDGSALTNIPVDNMGNHLALQNIQMNGHWLSNDGEDDGVFVADNGFVGIGTDEPTTKLQIKGTGQTATISLLKDDTLNECNVSFDGSGTLFNIGTPNADRFRIWTSGGGESFTMTPNGFIGIGTVNPQQKLDVRGRVRSYSVEITGGSDIAEPYDVLATADITPTAGMVVSIDPANLGKLRVSDHAYDRTVAGIISGANGVNPGLTLTQDGSDAHGTMPVANMGRVWCLCDADEGGAILAGDLLTTSDTAGHAMKVADHARSQGAIIGKAMSNLECGRGFVLVLVSLQ